MSVSIVVPTYNRPAQLAACLEALAQLRYPRARFEVIVVDDGSAVLPEALIEPWRERLSITLLCQPHAGPAAARNAGAQRAHGEFLAFTDDDCAPAADWLEKLAARLAATPQHMVGGQTANALPDNRFSTASQLLIDYLYAYYNGDPCRARFFTSNNLALSAEGFRAVGLFDTSLTRAAGEDRDLCDRWLQQGNGMIFAPEAVVYHAHALTLARFWRQHYRYGQAAYYFHQKRARRGHGRIQLEPLKFYVRLLRYPFTQKRGIQAAALAILLFLSQLANALGYFRGKDSTT